ncbi:glycosyltransferase family 4 protein [Sungkyunkwania multivorans]|uniref:Glycosyltransferase family 4 protein n=1 Tax=Sungkyunkwania multivorans TaxID=1173618 RepID=A0ABW3D211_9FLAO
MLKILYIGNNLQKKGRTTSTIDSLGKLLEARYKVYYASSINNKFFRLMHMLFSVIKRRKVNVVLIDTYSTFNFYYAYLVSLFCRMLRLPYIPILHGGNLPNRILQSPKMSTAVFKNAVTNVSPSKYMLEAFENLGYDNVTYIPNNIELDHYQYRSRSEVQPKLLWVRSFSSIYNPTMAVEVLKILLDKGYEASLCMVGPEKDGSLEATKEKAKALGVEVTFTGKLTKEEWIKRSEDHDIFVNTTNFDNMPVSVIEAMALGLPVVSTKVGGIPFLLEDGKDAMLVAPHDKIAMAAAVEELVSRPDIVKSITGHARTKAETFDWQTIKNQWFKLLDDVA